MKYDELKTMEDAMDIGHICQAFPYVYVYKPEQESDMVVGITIGADIKNAAAYRFDAESVQQLIKQLEELWVSMLVCEDDLKAGDIVILSEEGIIKWCEDGEEDDHNPRNTIGEVINTASSEALSIEVRWANGNCNEYRKQHLTKIKM